MAKLTAPLHAPIKFTILDGFKPERNPSTGVYKLKLPIPLNLQSKEEVLIKTGVMCNYPVHLFASTEKKAIGLDLVDGVWACQDAGQELEVKVKNTSNNMLLLEARETVAKFVVLFGNYLSEE